MNKLEKAMLTCMAITAIPSSVFAVQKVQNINIEQNKIKADNTKTKKEKIVDPKVFRKQMNLRGNIASGTFGTMPWYISSDQTLHLGSGQLNKTTHSFVSLWCDKYDNQIKHISIDGNVTFQDNKAAEYLFARLSKVQNIEHLDRFDFSNVTSIMELIPYCESLESVDLTGTKFNPNMEDEYWLFWGNTVMKSVNLGDMPTEKVTNMADMFTNNKALREITFPKNFTTKSIEQNQYPQFPNMDSTHKWRAVGDGTKENPTGDIYNSKIINTAKQPIQNDTYVLTDKLQPVAKTINMWTQNDKANPGENTGDYGDSGFTNYIYKDDPFKDTVKEDDLNKPGEKIEVIAKGIKGKAMKPKSSDIKWYLTKNGELHLSGGVYSQMYHVGEVTETGPTTPIDPSETDPTGPLDPDINFPAFRSAESRREDDDRYRGEFELDGDLVAFDNRGVWPEETKEIFLDGEITIGTIPLNRNPNTDVFMFADTPKLEKIHNLNNLNIIKDEPSSVEISKGLDYMFDESGITELDLSSFDTTNIKSMNHMLDDAPRLKKITFGNNFAVPNEPENQTKIPNQTKAMKWREIGTGTEENPNGEYLNENANEPFYLNFKPKAGTYVLEPQSKTINMWTANGKVKPYENTGNYGDDGFTNYVYKDDPFKDTVKEDDLNKPGEKVEVIAKGVKGKLKKPTPSDIKWYLTKNGELHLSGGVYSQMYDIIDDSDSVRPIDPIDPSEMFLRSKQTYDSRYDFVSTPENTNIKMEPTKKPTWPEETKEIFLDGEIIIGGIGLTNIEIDSDIFMFAKTPNLEEIHNLKNLNIQKDDPTWKTKNKSLDYMFSDSGITKLDLSTFNTSNIYSMYGMLDDAPRLKKITFGNDFEVPNEQENQTKIPNQTSTMKWREIGTGTEEHPNGEYLNENANEPFYLNFKPKAGTYVLYKNTNNEILDPDDSTKKLPKDDLGTDTKDNTKNYAELAIDAVPNFEFGEHELDYDHTEFKPNQNKNSNKNLPHFVQITNTLDNAQNFDLTVKDDGFKDNATNNIMNAKMNLTTGNVITNNSKNSSSIIPTAKFDITDDETTILKAPTNALNGSFQMQFNPEDTKLIIPKNQMKIGDFSDTITWSLNLAD